VRALVDADLTSAYAGDPSAKSIDEIIFCFPGFAAIIRHRFAHQLYRLGVTMIARIIAEHAHSETGIDIRSAKDSSSTTGPASSSARRPSSAATCGFIRR
jgi:serine acetyltransferase